VRAFNGVAGAPSNEAVVTIGTVACVPPAPTDFWGRTNGSSILLEWSRSTAGCEPTTYVIEAGSRSGASDLANFTTGTRSIIYTANGVAGGTYYLRVRASAGGTSTSAPSNEIVLSVRAVAPLDLVGTWTGTIPAGPSIGQTATLRINQPGVELVGQYSDTAGGAGVLYGFVTDSSPRVSFDVNNCPACPYLGFQSFGFVGDPVISGGVVTAIDGYFRTGSMTNAPGTPMRLTRRS
jgi:hypothetical protein